MTDYIGLIQGRLATSDAVLRQVLSWLQEVRPETPGLFGRDDHGNYVDAWRHGGAAALLAYHHGYGNVKRWGDALEDYHPDNEWEFRQDVRNNEVGAKIGALARLTGMTIPELGDALKAAFKAGAFQTDAYAPYSGSSTFRVGDVTLSVSSGVVTLPDGSRFDLTKSGFISVDGTEYPLLHVIRRDGSVQDNWTNMEDSRTLFQSGIGKWELPLSGDTPATSFEDRFAAMVPRAPATAGSLQQDSRLSPTLPSSLSAPSLTSSMFSPTPIANSSPAFGGAIGRPSDAFSPTMPAPRNDRRSAAPDGPAWTSAQGADPATPALQQDAAYSPAGDFFGNFPRVPAFAATPSPLAFNGSGSSSGPLTADDFQALAQSVSGILVGARQFLGNSLVPSAEAASPGGPLLRTQAAPNTPGTSPITEASAAAYLPDPSGALAAEATGSAPSVVKKGFPYLARIIADKPQASVFDTGAAPVPLVLSDNPNFRSGLPGMLAASLAHGDPQNPTSPCRRHKPAGRLASSAASRCPTGRRSGTCRTVTGRAVKTTTTG